MKRHPIGVGLIGVGRHGSRYARHLLQDLPTASLKAVCRRHHEQSLDIPGAESVKIHGKADALIADPSVQVVIAVVPPIFSRDICRLAIEARKPMLIEKPLATSAADARVMVAAARQAGVALMTGQTLRFDSTIQEMKMRQHFIGRSQRLHLTSHIETRVTDPDHASGYGKRGVLLEVGIHMLDLVRFLTGEEVQEVRCTMDQIPPVRSEAVASANLTTQGGTVCMIDVAWVPERRAGQAQWIGSEGLLQADWTHRRFRWIRGAVVEDREISPSQTVLAALAAFLQAVEDRAPMPITGEDGCRAVEIAEACYRSAQAGGVPIAPSLAP